jgi:hypothetical protein
MWAWAFVPLLISFSALFLAILVLIIAVYASGVSSLYDKIPRKLLFVFDVFFMFLDNFCLSKID